VLQVLATWDELERFEEEWERALLKLSDAAREAVRAATVEAPREAINTKRFRDQTGLLTSRIKGFVEISVPGGAIGEIGAYTEYASYVDGGTKPHEIHAGGGAQGALLTFKGSNGQWVSVHAVPHPGTKPTGFGGVLYNTAEAVMIREVDIGIDQLKRFLEG
jgi:hypothetical protein